jgi:hypothetical protein
MGRHPPAVGVNNAPYNNANDCHMLHPVAVAAKKAPEVDRIQV